ncbi:hypothetical protein PG997_009967 [Apiospora hydei]|uniref:Myb-like domain-containing protein n=1 Tax=Apiospora hydei TaxID=1337664 RepID=A0ABR1VZF1_9PEZI
MSDDQRKPDKPGKGGKDKDPLTDREKLLMELYFATEKKQKDSWRAHNWDTVAARRGLTPAAAKIRFKGLCDQFEDERKEEIITPPVVLPRKRRNKQVASNDDEYNDDDDVPTSAAPTRTATAKGRKNNKRAVPHDDDDDFLGDGENSSPVKATKKRARGSTRGSTTRRATLNFEDDVEDDGEDVPSNPTNRGRPTPARLPFPNLLNPNRNSIASQIRQQEEQDLNLLRQREQQRQQDENTRRTWGLPTAEEAQGPAEGPANNGNDNNNNENEGEGQASGQTKKKRTRVPKLEDKHRKVAERECLARKRKEDQEEEDQEE